jgi:hypothetical protein
MSDELVSTEPSRSLRAAEFRSHQQFKPLPIDAMSEAGVNNHRHMQAPSEIPDDTPLPLAEAVKLAFPGGKLTAGSLRTEARKGRLEIIKIAGKDHTTLRAIGEMIELCRAEARARGYGSSPPGDTRTDESSTTQSGSSSTADASVRRARAILKSSGRPRRLHPRQKPARRGNATVIPLRSGSPT